MIIIKNIVIPEVAPDLKEVGWLLPLQDGTFKLRFFSSNGWVDAASGVQGPQGEKEDKGDKGAAGANGKLVTAIKLTTDETGKVTGGTATLSDKSTIQITVTQG